MCDNKTATEIRATCNSSCRLFFGHQCPLRRQLLEDILFEATGPAMLENRHPPASTTSRTMLHVVR